MQYVVTTKGKPARRYVLVDSDRSDQAAQIQRILREEAKERKEAEQLGYRFDPIRPLFWFGTRWVQSRNRANEMYRTLSITDVERIKAVPDGTVALTP